jgi:hypothetical protein
MMIENYGFLLLDYNFHMSSFLIFLNLTKSLNSSDLLVSTAGISTYQILNRSEFIYRKKVITMCIGRQLLWKWNRENKTLSWKKKLEEQNLTISNLKFFQLLEIVKESILTKCFWVMKLKRIPPLMMVKRVD